MTYLKKLFTLPVYKDEIESQQAYLLHIIVWTLIFIPIPFVVYTIFLTHENVFRTLMQAAFGEGVNIILLVMLHRKHVRAAAILQVSAFWLFFTVTAATGDGVKSEAYLLGYGLVIMIAGILLGRTGSFFFALLSLSAGAFMVYAQTSRMLIPGTIESPLTTWVVSLVLFPVGAMLQYLASQITQNALNRAKESEEKYRLISRVSSDYTFITEVSSDGSSNLSWVAGAFEKMTGYTYEEYVASGGWLGHVHPDDLEKDALDMERLSNNQDVQSEIRTFTKNGEIRWEQIFAHPVWDDKENRLVRIIGAVRDITEQKRIEAVLAHERDILQIFMDNIPDQIYFKDIESRFERINQSQANFLGVENPQDAIGKTDFDYQKPELAQELLKEEKQVIETGQPLWNHLEFNPTEDGTPRWLSTTKVPAKNELGQIVGIIGISRNITEQKKTEVFEQNRRAMLENVIKLGKIVTEANNIDSTLEKIWHGIHDDLEFDRLGIFLYNPEKNSMDRVLGTTNQGEMDKTPGMVFSLETRNIFSKVLENPDGLYFTHNFDIENNVLESNEMYGVKDHASVAVWSGEKPVAIISVDRLLTGIPITDIQLEALHLFAGYAGLAIENAKLNKALQNEITQLKFAEDREKERRAMLEKVVKLGQQVSEVFDLRATLIRIWQLIHDELGFDRPGIFLYNPNRISMDGTFGTNMQGEMIDEWHTWYSLKQDSKESRSFLHVFEKPDTIFLTQSFAKDHNTPEGDNMSGVGEHANVGAWAGEKPVAIISVDNRITQRPFTKEQLEGLRLFAGYAGLAIENARLNTELQNELAQRKETLLHQSAILNGIPDMAWLKDINSRYVAVNEQFAKIAGMKIEEIIGKTDFEIWNESFAQKYRNDDLEVIQSGQRIRHIEELQTDSTGREYWVETTKTPILNENKEVIGTTGIAREITERKNAEIEREALITELETKNAELERYTYTVSHDLKSPLVTIRGFLGYLEKDALAGNTQKVKEDIARIEHATEKMQTLLNDLLELSRIGRLMNQPTDVLFTDIAKDAIALVDGQIKEKNISVQIDDTPAIVHGDRTRLTEVIQNLVDNAVKFTSDRPNPQIIIGATTNKMNETVFFVRDNGIGIDRQYHDRIFTLFNKLNTDTEGTGIGLTLVKRIIEIHNGRIWLESEPGKGATFYFTLNQT